MKEGLYTKKLKAERVICSLCYQQCILSPDCRGFCNVRENKKGRVYTRNYQKFREEKVDKIEIVPLFHFLPGTKTFVLGSVGNNLVSSTEEEVDKSVKELKKITPDQAVKRAVKNECSSITFLTDEPTMFYESLVEIAKNAKSNKLKNVLRTNGYLHEKSFGELLKYLHAISFELDSADKETFLRLTNGKLSHVEKNIKMAIEKGIWIEINTILKEDLNDNEGELRKIAAYIADLDKTIPWHVENAHDKKDMFDQIKKEYELVNVYLDLEDTLCPKCGKIVISRKENTINAKKGVCEKCKKGRVVGIF